MFFFGVYMMMIVGIARAADVPNKDMIGHLLEAFSLASLIGVVFGIMNIMFPLMITLIQVVRAARA
jgi:purine-cytosine permease-like protein